MHYERFPDGSVKCIEDELPFDIPEGWGWCRLGNIVTLMSGTTYPTEKELSSGERLYIKVSDMNIPENEYEIVTSSRYLDEYSLSNLVPLNSVIFPKRGGAIATNKKKLVLQKEILVDLNIMAFTPIYPISILYCFLWFLSVDLVKLNSGTSVPQINNKDINPLLFPLPPLPEQHRIADKLSEIMSVIDNLESDKNDILSAIQLTRSKILDLAIRGKLVPQDPNDEPASVLLERIRNEKEDLVKQGKIKRDKNESVIFRCGGNNYFEKLGDTIVELNDWEIDNIPESWEVCYLGEVCDYGNCINVEAENISETAWILDLEDIEKDTGRIIQRLTKKERDSASTKHLFHKGQVLYSKLRPYLNKVVLADDNGYCTSEILPLEFNACILPKYARYYLMSPTFLRYANHCSYGVKMPRLGTSDGKKAVLTVPPLNEQKRIVEKISALFEVLDNIEKNLN